VPNERHSVRLGGIESDCKPLKTSEGGENDPFAKPLYGLTPVPRVRIPPSPPLLLLSGVYESVIPILIPS
jgi:hypothetical protein